MSKVGEEAIRSAFNFYDVDGSGKISVNEIKNVMDRLGLDLSVHKIKAEIDQFDSNKNGELEYEEFYDFFMKVLSNSNGNLTLEEETAALFRLLDTNRDGRIDRPEIKAFFNQIILTNSSL